MIEKLKIGAFAVVCIPTLLVSCATPKAEVVEQPAAPPKNVEKPVEQVSIPEPEVSQLPEEDGLRMPEILGMPTDEEFRASGNPAIKSGRDSGAVISRPPTDPPSRVKPKTDDPE